MIKCFFSFLNIEASEGKNTALFALLAFLWAFAITAAQKFGDTLFLHHIGAEGLPLTYQLSACSLITLAVGMMYAFGNVKIHRIYISLLSATSLFYIAVSFYLYFFANPDTRWTWYAVRVFGTVIFAISVTCYWSFVDHFHNRVEAKRLYSLFSSSIFMGIISTGSLMKTGWMTIGSLSILISFLLGISILIIRYIVNTVEQAHGEDDRIGASSLQTTAWRKQIELVLTSPFTLLLISANFITYVLLVITEYSYLSTFQEIFGTTQNVMGNFVDDSSPLTQFLGQWIAVANIINLFIGLFLYSRILARFGLGALVVCSPLFLLITFCGWSSSNSLTFPVLGLFVVEGMLLVIDDSNFNLLLNEVPGKIKYKLRLAIESCFEPLGMIVSSLLLSIPHVNSKVLGMVLSATFLVIALCLRKYIREKNLQSTEIVLTNSVPVVYTS